ncbi:T9SS type B sorting domain-containing protein [Neotamlana laminarinivorans]|uniref:T9SS type B sorting domain-containing protein n=1 Tax=Neotamlana laminarinivorans TaxID=2883124 RepID=A0A9X1L536_9FLAO|nr:T9SS type B sorting domain-containing protein [Tamlana laminarinivorans]MCB4798956.1 T9SS type B sorting domain-containing protein [Tamlana laminarinivorans]
MQLNQRLFYLMLLWVCSIKGYAQLSTTHYIPPLTSSEYGNANPENQYLYISTPSNTSVPFTIIPIGQPATSYITDSVDNNTPFIEYLGNGNGQLFVDSNFTATITNNKGYIIEADAPVYVSIRMEAGSNAQAGALVSKGLSALDTSFRIGMFTSENPQDNYLSFASVMATEDNTIVTFSDLPNNLILKNHTGGYPISVTLDKGESYIIAANIEENETNNLTDGLIGGLISSNLPVVVNCGSTNGSFHNGTGRDYGLDQIAGLSKIGNEYIFVKGNGSNDWENVLIVAHTNNTSIGINGSAPVATINAGEYYVIEGNNYNTFGNMYVETSENVFAYQGIGSSSEANQGLFFVPPLSCETRGNIDNIADIDNIGGTTYDGGVSIVTRTGANITINNLALSNYNVIGPSTVSGNSAYVTYKVTGLTNNISVQGDDELYVAYFNVNGSATSGGYYSGFPTAPEISFDTQFATLGHCIPNVSLEAANADSFDTYEWYFDDGSGYQLLSTNVPSITPTIPGKYKLIGTITCTGETLESTEVPVSLCPDDIDNDGIIDNLDIDNDNDGILNCTESKGDVTINLSDVTNPELVFQDNTTNISMVSASYTETSSSGSSNTLFGDNLGGFISILGNDTSAQSEYTLNFSETVNFKFTESSITSASNNNEYFVVKITPSNKNITLVDPDDKLLVDSNFDGVFETGITQISGSEIHFKINTASTGNTPYQFLANTIDSFSFYHYLSDQVTPSTFTGNISLTCFKKDSDNDGLKDELDLDSDNDGIPDNIEGSGQIVELTGIDNDFDGLDDVYDGFTIPIDTDNDGIYDFYDLDSDNDGIYDLIETGQLGTLSDTNLDGVEDGPNYGTNGWTDAAETSADSNILGYVLNDLDNDTVFSYIDYDSDGDGCSDVIEAGFTDENLDTYVGNNTVTVDANGLVTNAVDGYTLPDSSYLNYAPISISTQPEDITVCELSSGTFSVSSTEAENYQWELSTDGSTWQTLTDNINFSGSTTQSLTVNNTPNSFNNYKFRVLLNRSGNTCGLYSNEVTLFINALPTANTPNTYTQCDDASNDGQAFFNLTLNSIKEDINPNYISEGLSFSYFETETDAQDNTNAISTPENYQDSLGFTPETIWVRVENANGCYRAVALSIVVSPSSVVLNAYNPDSIYQCDDGTDNYDGIATFNFSSVKDDIENSIFSNLNVTTHFYESEEDATLETNEIIDISNHTNTSSPNNQSIWVRVKSNLGNNCLGLKELNNLLIVEALPDFSIVENQIVCSSNPDFTVVLDPDEVNTNETYNYEWHFTSLDGSIAYQLLSETTSTLTVSEPGTYFVTLTTTNGTNCSETKEVFVNASELATLTTDDITIVDFTKNNNSVTVNTSNLGLGDYEFALAETGSLNVVYQDSPEFYNVTPGLYTLYVNDKKGCGQTSLELSVMGIMKFFTPNNDGYNDTWQIIGLNNSTDVKTIFIFDRYGKLLKQASSLNEGWDGTSRGILMPTGDYWYKISLNDGRTFNGHFTLKR